MVMTDKVRYAFRHGITPRKSDIIPIQTQSKRCLTLRPRQERISLTFRKSITDSCSCSYSRHCPSQSEDKVEEMSNDTASKLEKLHVHEVYEKIADHFSETRYKPWPKVMNFLHAKLLDHPGAVLVDVGCGNGKYLGDVKLKHIQQIGLDYSRNLLSFVTNKGCDAIRSDVLTLPLKDGVATACINIAVIHHLSTKVCVMVIYWVRHLLSS